MRSGLKVPDMVQWFHGKLSNTEYNMSCKCWFWFLFFLCDECDCWLILNTWPRTCVNWWHLVLVFFIGEILFFQGWCCYFVICQTQSCTESLCMAGAVVVCTDEAGLGVCVWVKCSAWHSYVFTVLVKSTIVAGPEAQGWLWLFKHFITC